MICERHRVTHLSYVDRHRLASAHFDAGFRQQLCPICLLWFWPWEMDEPPPREPTGLWWVCCHPGLWILLNSLHQRLGVIHMCRPGKWEAALPGTENVTWHENAPDAAHALAQAIRKIS